MVDAAQTLARQHPEAGRRAIKPQNNHTSATIYQRNKATSRLLAEEDQPKHQNSVTAYTLPVVPGSRIPSRSVEEGST
jgi:hypothetical protein